MKTKGQSERDTDWWGWDDSEKRVIKRALQFWIKNAPGTRPQIQTANQVLAAISEAEKPYIRDW